LIRFIHFYKTIPTNSPFRSKIFLVIIYFVHFYYTMRLYYFKRNEYNEFTVRPKIDAEIADLSRLVSGQKTVKKKKSKSKPKSYRTPVYQQNFSYANSKKSSFTFKNNSTISRPSSFSSRTYYNNFAAEVKQMNLLIFFPRVSTCMITNANKPSFVILYKSSRFLFSVKTARGQYSIQKLTAFFISPSSNCKTTLLTYRISRKQTVMRHKEAIHYKK